MSKSSAIVLDRRTLDAQPFPAALCERLFAAVQIDDEIDDNLVLPERIELDHPVDTLIACFRLSRQQWAADFEPSEIARITAALLRGGELGEAERVRLKHVRAKFKHLRYAHSLYGVTHRYPRMLDRTAITMGHLQDAYRHGRRMAVIARTVQLRLLLTAPAVAMVRRESDRLAPTDTAAFRRLLEADYAKLAALLARPRVTGHVFHATRKVVGRQVSFWDTLRTLDPTADRFRTSRWMSAINGIMGAMHDRLVEQRAANRASYGEAFELPDDLRRRIAALLDRVTRSTRV